MHGWFFFVLRLLLAAALFSSARGEGDYGLYDYTIPTGMHLSWNSSRGVSGTIEYLPGTAGTFVRDEGNGGTTRRAVLAPGNADCVPFPATTTNHRGQVAGIPYDRNVFVIILAMLNRPCSMMNTVGQFGPQGAMKADPAGVIWMWSDENDAANIGPRDKPSGSVAGKPNGVNDMTYPLAWIARGPEPDGGLTMATEIFNGHRVDIFWPGTGPMTDFAERAALKDLMRNMQTTHDGFQAYADIIGFGGTVITPEEFVADDSLDPCTNNGQGKRLMYVTCIGGHVVSLSFDILTHPVFTAFPPSILQLTELRHVIGTGVNTAELTFPCEFGSLANLVALAWGAIQSSGSAPLVFPADDRCMDGLVRLEEVMLGDYVVNRLPASIFSLPNIQKVSVRGAPLAMLPRTMPPKLRVLKLSGTGVSGPLPSFGNSSLLEEVALDNNRLTLGDASAFDYCPELKSVKLSYNNISSDLFTFDGTTKLETFEASQNMIRGGIPSQWELLTSCEKVVLSHNLLEATLKPIMKMAKLKYLDLVSRVREECMF
jgi:hypothetical protein